MPTGYTYAVQEGKVTEFRDFAMACARAFGALVEMRDDPNDAPIPDEFKPHTSYHDEALVAAQKTLAKLPGLHANECQRRADAVFDAAVAERQARQIRRETERQRYSAMIEKAAAWQPPTPDHEGMQDFMLEQLRTSLDHDCNDRYDEAPKWLTGEQWRRDELDRATRDIAYHTEKRDDEIRRAARRTAWVRALRESLRETTP